MAWSGNPEIDVQKVEDQFQVSNDINRTIQLEFVSKPREDSQVVDVYVQRIFKADDKSTLKDFWGLEKSHLHMSYVKKGFRNGQQLCVIQRPARMTMRASGNRIFTYSPPSRVLDGIQFMNSMRFSQRGNDCTQFNFMLDCIQREAPGPFARDYAKLNEDEMAELFEQWNGLLLMVQLTMVRIFGGDVPWSLGPV